jgi:hypothetical protein
MSRGAAGPWVVVVGMHRSGTSAVTGAIGALGFNAVSDDDRMSPHESNPEHWESLSLALHNDAILGHFGGTWDAPPELADGWERDAGLPDRTVASELLAAAYPRPGPSVWKDPRVCLTLPYWRELLGAPMVAVLVWRAPFAVASSLRRRDGIPVPVGLALWERYNRSAVANLARTPTFALEYDGLLEDPPALLASLVSWLGSTGQFDGMPPWEDARARSFVDASLRHESVQQSEGDERIILDEQRQLCEHLIGVSGSHRALPQPTNAESPWTTAILDARGASNLLELRRMTRELEHVSGERDWYAEALEEARAHLANLKATASWRVTAPLRWAGSRDRRGNG